MLKVGCISPLPVFSDNFLLSQTGSIAFGYEIPFLTYHLISLSIYEG